MSETDKEAATPPAADNKGEPKEVRESGFIRLLQNLNNTVVVITAFVVAVGGLITAVVAITHHAAGRGDASSNSSPTRIVQPSPTSSSTHNQRSATGSATGSARILDVTDPVHTGCIGSTLRVKLNIATPVTGSGQLWVMAAVAVPGGTVYDAKAELNNVAGPQVANVELVNSARGSSRNLLVVSASNSAEFSWLATNQANDGKSGWDINRRDLHGVTRVSNLYLVRSSC
ncbi:MAG TPA: hypothetical protein VHZ33_02100 [Trebonia sp.]|jgi:hypothetical protein|nr:hypothetical protein [Trebonia sp.]